MLDFLLQQYRDLLTNLDNSCKAVLTNVIETPCRKGCYDCCKQLFPLSLIEAFYINQGFQTLEPEVRNSLADQAQKATEAIKDLDLLQFETFSDSLEDIAEARNSITRTLQSTKIDCPLLIIESPNSESPSGTCLLYPYRNHDCRIHGVSVDPNSGEIIGCFRHPQIFNTPALKQNFASHAVPSNYLYKDKSKLDSLLTVELGQDPNLKYCYYFTTPYTPLTEDFATKDWPAFFKEKLDGKPQTKYSLIVDTTINFTTGHH